MKNNIALSFEIINKMATSDYLKNRQEICLFLKSLRTHQKLIKINQKRLKFEELKKRRIEEKLKKAAFLKEYRKNYYLKNIDKIRKYRKEWYLKQKQLNFKKRLRNQILNNLRSRLSHALKRNSKNAHTITYLGCSIEELKQHLEKQFEFGMNWENYGKWHIDHIRPCASFDLSKLEEQCKCFNFNNLQPLWGELNIKKSNKF